MRLRYLHLQNYPPVADIKVCFANDSPLARECAIRFVVGLNGSGKSNLLRGVAEVFLALTDLRVPAFPVSLVYELGVRESRSHRTLLLHCPGSRKQASLWLYERFAFDDKNGKEEFNANIEHLSLKGQPMEQGFSPLIAPGNWPLRDSSPPQIALPSAVLAYTTGDLRPWHSIWNRNQHADSLLDEGGDFESDERPSGWTVAQENALQASRQANDDTPRQSMDKGYAEMDRFRRPVLLDATLLKCALLAVTLQQTFVETENYQGIEETTIAKHRQHTNFNSPLQELLERGGWHRLVSVAFRSHLQTAHWDQKLCETAHDWWLCASEIITEPHPLEVRRTLWFDLRGPFDGQGSSFLSAAHGDLPTCTNQGEALWTLLGWLQGCQQF